MDADECVCMYTHAYPCVCVVERKKLKSFFGSHLPTFNTPDCCCRCCCLKWLGLFYSSFLQKKNNFFCKSAMPRFVYLMLSPSLFSAPLSHALVCGALSAAVSHSLAHVKVYSFCPIFLLLYILVAKRRKFNIFLFVAFSLC